MDERLAVEAELRALPALGLEPGQVVHVVVDPVEDDLAGLAGAEQCGREVGDQGRPTRSQRRPKLLGEVVGAEHQHLDLVEAGDRPDVEHGHRRLDHGPDRDVADQRRHRAQVFDA